MMTMDVYVFFPYDEVNERPQQKILKCHFTMAHISQPGEALLHVARAKLNSFKNKPTGNWF